MTIGRPRPGRPVVVVPHGHRSVPPLQLVAAAEGLCDLVWLVRSDDPETAAVGRLLQRTGAVVDTVGMDAARLASTVAAFGPHGVVAFRDQDLVAMAELAARLELPFHRPEVARRLADKLDQRHALRDGGVPVPEIWEIPSPSDPAQVAAVAADVTYPAVLKPRCGSGSRHTLAVHDRSELVSALARLACVPADAEPMIVEGFLPSMPGAGKRPFADYVSVETLVDGRRRHHLAVTGRLHPAEPFRETGFFMPSDLGPAEWEAVLATATEALDALGVRTGCVHTEVKLTPGGPRVIEVNGRMGGGVPDILAAAGGPDLLALHLGAALGRPLGLDGPVRTQRIGYRLFLQPPVSARRLCSVGGLRQLGEIPGVESVSLHLRPGDAIDPQGGTRSFVLAIVGHADRPDEVRRASQLMEELADVVYEHATAEHATAEHAAAEHATDGAAPLATVSMAVA